MQITKLLNLINSKLAGETLMLSQIEPFLDDVIDDINSRLHSRFNYFREMPGTQEFSEFPDYYISSVLVIGAVAKWYVADEEGIQPAVDFQTQYDNNLALMVRDYINLVPDNKRQYNDASVIKPSSGRCGSSINPDIRYREHVGPPGSSVIDARISVVGNERHLFLMIAHWNGSLQTVDAGKLAPEIIDIRLDVENNLVMVMTDGTFYVVGNLGTAVMDSLVSINPIVNIIYTSSQVIGVKYDGTEIVLSNLPALVNSNLQWIVKTGESESSNVKAGDIISYLEEL